MSDAEVLDFPEPKLPDRNKSVQDPQNRKTEKPSQDDDGMLFRKLKQWDQEGREHHSHWRSEAEEDFEFAAGWQWDSADIAALRSAKRPYVSIDRVGRNINAVCGLEINNRQRATTYPRETGDIEEAEIPSAALAFVADETDAEDEESSAFRDMLIAGLGWTATEMNYLDYEDGMPAEVKVSPAEMNWDPYAKRSNLRDARWIRRALTMPIEEARRLCPEADDVTLHAGWADVFEEGFGDHPDRDSRTYENNSEAQTTTRKRVVLLEFQWKEVEDFYTVVDQQTGRQHDVHEMLGRRIEENSRGRFQAVKRQRYAYWRALVGTTVLKKSRMETQRDFTYQAMTGFWDETRKQWFGLVRAMKDPQRVANNLYSHSLSMFKHGVKSGFIYEKGSIKDIRSFERDQAKVGANLRVEDGSLQGGRVQPISPTPPPAHAHELLNMSMSQVQEATGIPLEMVATATGNGPAQTAMLEAGRRKAGMNLLAPFFAAKKMHKKRQSKLVLRYVVAFMNDGRLMRIVEEGQTRYVPLFLEDPDISQYDIVVDESPTAPDARERSWAVIQQLMPMMQQMGAGPDLMVEVARYIPDFPAALLTKIAKVVEEASQPSPEKERQEQLQARAEEAAVAKEEGQAAKEKTAAELNRAKVQEIAADVALDATEQMRETALAKAAPPGGVQFTEFA